MFSFILRLLPQVSPSKHWAFLCFACVLTAINFLPSSFMQQAEYLYDAPFSLRWWSAHFIHLNVSHGLMNIANALLLWILAVAYVPSGLLLLLLIVGPWGISLGISYSDLASSVQTYRGFSGLLYSFYVAGVVHLWPQERITAIALAVFLSGKLWFEQKPDFDIAYLNDYLAGVVAVDAHLYGALMGLLLTVFWQFFSRLYFKKS